MYLSRKLILTRSGAGDKFLRGGTPELRRTEALEAETDFEGQSIHFHISERSTFMIHWSERGFPF